MYIFRMVLLSLLICTAVSYGEMIIVDNLDPGFTTTGSDWKESSAIDEYKGSSLYTNDIGDTARWTPDLPRKGMYAVYAWWASTYPGGGIMDRDTKADYTIISLDPPTTVVVDQTKKYGRWNYLGTFKFAAGQGGYVELIRDAACGMATNADAVKFKYIIPEPLTLTLLAFGGVGLLAKRRS